MDFLVDFSKLFLEKHGKDIYDDICNEIKNENPKEYNDLHLQVVFKIALLNFWGMSDDKIKKFLKHTNNIDCNIIEITNVHKNSINKIQQHLKNVTKGTNL